MCVCLWLSLIVLRWTCAVDRLWKSSYCQMFLSALLSGPTQIPHKYRPFGPLSGVVLDCQWSPLDPSVVWPLTVSEAPLTAQWCGPWLSVQPPWPLSGVALDCQCSPLDPTDKAHLTIQWCGPWLSVQPPWPHWWSPLTSQWHGPWLSVQPPLLHWWSPLDCSVVWPLTVSAAPLTPLMKPLDLSVAWPLTVSAAPFIPLMKPPWLFSDVVLDCRCSPLDPSVVWPLTVSAAPLTPQWCGPWLSAQPPWLSVQPPWPLSGVALDCQCSPLDPSVVWPLTVSAAPLTVSAAPLTPKWCGPWLSVQPQSVRFCVCSSQWTLAWWNRCPRTSRDRGSPITRWTSCG